MNSQLKTVSLLLGTLGVCTSAPAQSLLSTMASSNDNEWVIGAEDAFSIAEEFTTGSQSESIGSVSFEVNSSTASGDPLTVRFYSNNSGQPGSLVADGSLTGPAHITENAANTFTASGLTLAANTAYWLVFDNTTSTDVDIANRQGGSLVTTTSAGWVLDKLGYELEGSGPNYSFAYTGIAEPLFAIASPVPEPGTIALASLGGLGLWFLRRQK
jgi:hypothetical protein